MNVRKPSQSKGDRLTDTYRWPIYTQSSRRTPSHWWPGMCTGPDPPLWSDQCGGSRLLVISQYLKMVAHTLRLLNAAAAAVCMRTLCVLPDPWDRARSSLYHVTVGGGMPSEAQLSLTELLALRVQSVRLLSSTGGSRTERKNTHTVNMCALYVWDTFGRLLNVTTKYCT